ncbi:arrestin domain-containing protein 3 [Plakobranchus ocellatus]|uniref:Arrestin domain-containing protein 3 n=1 Tax=Plakobranchus ocellatus TaxID=259542 RepID=A0AAV4CYG9_9GAST|nr:arrestin domain-containing protein 3 [Plakobranchus ocellatus]
MGKLKLFDIALASPGGVFYAGNAVTGHVTVELSEAMEMRGIKLSFKGKAKVHWTESETTGSGSNQQTRTVTYSAKEKYFNQDVLLHGIWSSQGSATTQLPQGLHTFPFQFFLPAGLPSSFEGEHGRVRYAMTCKIDRPWKFDHKTKRPFTVISILDLNSQPSYAQRVQGEKQKHLCCLCCKSGPIVASFHLDRQGYVPGEAIILSAEISNGASRKMDKSYVELKMITTFRATTKSRTQTKVVGRVSRPEIPGHSEDVWSGEQLVIPPVPPSFLLGCNIIDIRYVVQLNVDPSGPALDLEIPLEIIIGTIPLMSVVAQNPPMAPVGFDNASPWPLPPPSEAGMPQIPPNLPPPSYNECITGQVDIRGKNDEHTRGDLSFAPAYTYYNWGNTPNGLPN